MEVLRIENQGDSFKYEISGEEKTLISELIEIGGLVLATITRSSRQANVSIASREHAIMRMADSIAADMAKMAAIALDEGMLPEEESHGAQ